MSNLRQFVDQFIKYLEERKASPLTIRNYAHYLSRFLEFLSKYSPTLDCLDAINQNIIREYTLFLSQFLDKKGKSLDSVTQGYHLIALRSFLRFLIRQGLININLESIIVPHGKSRQLKFLDSKQIELLLRLPDNFRDKSILELLLSTGLRVSDLVRLNKDNINFTDKIIIISGNHGQKRTVFFSETTSYWVKKYLMWRQDDSSALFVRSAGKKDASLRLTVRSIQRIIEKYVKKAGLPIKATPHTLRHTFAINLLSSGENLKKIQKLMGHKNISTTQIYTHVTNPQLREIHRRFHRKEIT